MIRIITGSAKGKRLLTLEGEATRPTTQRVKEAIFSALQFDIEGRRVLDLFGGCGQMGLEALSRGAVSAMFIDAAAEAMAIIKENAQKTDFFKCSRFLISDYRSYIRKAAGRDVYDLIFIDPPYASDAAADAVARIPEAKLAADGCLVVVESGAPLDTEENSALLSEFLVIKTARYSKSYVTILQKKGEDL
jgi:16S rRNA (guanine(966)-N(2))-methyltransferase RsmD